MDGGKEGMMEERMDRLIGRRLMDEWVDGCDNE